MLLLLWVLSLLLWISWILILWMFISLLPLLLCLLQYHEHYYSPSFGPRAANSVSMPTLIPLSTTHFMCLLSLYIYLSLLFNYCKAPSRGQTLWALRPSEWASGVLLNKVPLKHKFTVKLSELWEGPPYTRSPLEDSRLFGPSPWKILATTYENTRNLSNPAPGENLLSGNLVMETGGTPFQPYSACIWPPGPPGLPGPLVCV